MQNTHLKRRIVLDFDQTLVKSELDANGNRNLSTACYNESVLAWAKQMQDYGREVLLFTARGMTRRLTSMQLLEEMADWFMQFQDGYDLVKLEKPAGCAYVDDLAVHVSLIEQASMLGQMLEPDEMLGFYESYEFRRAYEVYLTKLLLHKQGG